MKKPVWVLGPLILIAAAVLGIRAQSGEPPSPTPSPSPTATPAPHKSPSFLRDIGHDQLAIWTLPFHLHGSDAKWLLPFGAGTVFLVKTDPRTSSWVERGGTLQPWSSHVSLFGSPASDLGVVGGFYFAGRILHNKRATETGRLAAEALIDSSIVSAAFKNTMHRPRPDMDNGRGTFFRAGNSFPSGHSSSAWSVATVIAYEYQDKPIVHYGAYVVAAAISMSRYSGRYHFLSEVVLGSGLGFFTGRYVYKTHHNYSNDPDDPNAPPPPPSGPSRLIPAVTPMYDPRTATYGARAVWSF